MRNPDWTRDETVLLMELYRSAPRAGKAHPEVAALSVMLRAAAACDGRAVSVTFRNAAGIAMRLRNFGKHDPMVPVGRDAGLRPGGAVDRDVWHAFGGDPQALTEEARRIRRLFAVAGWATTTRSSRGPVPTFGSRVSSLADGETDVYLLHVDGPLSVLAPSVDANTERCVCKLGRTGALDRRITELACGLPPSSAIRYLPIALRKFPSASVAHSFERRLLDLCDERGWSLGGEFAYAPLGELKSAMIE